MTFSLGWHSVINIIMLLVAIIGFAAVKRTSIPSLASIRLTNVVSTSCFHVFHSHQKIHEHEGEVFDHR